MSASGQAVDILSQAGWILKPAHSRKPGHHTSWAVTFIADALAADRHAFIIAQHIEKRKQENACGKDAHQLMIDY